MYILRVQITYWIHSYFQGLVHTKCYLL